MAELISAEWMNRLKDEWSADRDNWLKWTSDGIGMAGPGTAFAMGKLKFLSGDFKNMIKDPRMAGPFVKSFALMSRLDTR